MPTALRGHGETVNFEESCPRRAVGMAPARRPGDAVAMRRAALGLALFAAVPLALPAHPAAVQGWSAGERQRFAHGAIGSELLPLAWAKALVSARTGKPFLEQPERFGLLADPDDPDGLPVGLSAAESPDLRLSGRVVGLNCAACHTAELTCRGKRLRVDGGAGMFQVN